MGSTVGLETGRGVLVVVFYSIFYWSDFVGRRFGKRLEGSVFCSIV